jgi:PAS domain S-box-containing protein
MDPIVSLLVAVATGVAGFVAASRRRPAGEPPPRAPAGLVDAAIAAAGDALMVVDVGTLDEPGPRIVHVSPAFERMSGYRADECLGRSPRFLQGPQTDRAALDRLRKAIAAGKPVRERLVNYRKDGTNYWVEIDLSPVPPTDARRHYVAILRDVTREREIDDVVARGERRLLETLNAVDIGFLVWDASDRLVFWNARYLEIFPHMGAILVRGMTFSAYIEETASQMRAMGMVDRARWVATERAARHRRFGEMFRQRASFERDIETVEFPTADGGSVAVYRDVTTLAQAQREVKESQQRLLDSIEAIGDGIMIFDRDDRVMVWNRRYVEIFPEIAPVLAAGLRIEELRARVIDQAQRLTTSRDALSTIERRTRPHRRFGEPFNQKLASGRTLQIVEYATAEGGCVAVYRDVTEQLAVEEALRESELQLIDSIEAIGDGFLILDAEDRVRFWNRRYVEIFAHMDGLIEKGRPFAEIYDAGRERLAERDGTVLRGVATLDDRMRRHRRFGETFNQHLADGRVVETVQFAASDGGVVAVYRDVTAKIAADTARAESEARFQSLVANVDGVVFRRRIDAGWSMDFASSGIAGLTGYAAREFVEAGGRSYSALIVAEDRAAVSAQVASAVALRREFEVEYRLLRADGQIVWALEKGRASYDAYGAPLHIDGVIVDQTERKRREDELDRSRLAVTLRDRRFRDAIESMDDGFILYDADDNLIAWNERYLQFFPMMRERIHYGMSALEIVRTHARARLPDIAETELDAYARARLQGLRRGPLAPEDLRAGDRILQISRQRTSDGGLVAILRDVTEERTASQRVRASEARFRDAIASLADGFLQIDTETRIAAWNERYLDFYPALRGHVHEGMALRDALRIVADPSLSGSELDRWIDARLATVLPDGFLASESTVVGGRDLRITRTRMADGGVVLLLRDVTGDVAAARELERAKTAAEVASRAKTEFLANMSHELRTPLNGVVGVLDVMLASRLPDEPMRQARMARTSAERLLQVIGDILDISKLEAGALQIERMPFDVAQTVRSVVQAFAASAAAKGLAIDETIAPEIGGEAIGDPARLGQILMNLVGNAVKFTERGSVRVEASRAPGNAELAVFSVRDTGPGIDAATKARLFAKFFQADSSVTRRFGGTGLGLAISRELALAMGGDIVVRDAAGGGTVFEVTLPLPRSAGRDLSAAPPPPPPDVEGRWKHKRILLVEDNDVNRYAAAMMLEALGVGIDEAHDGEAAVRLAALGRYDLILMDVQMPRMDGLEATRRIRNSGGPNRTTPIVALTANAFVEDVARCHAAGMDAHLAKPIRAATLRAAVNEVFLSGAAADHVPVLRQPVSESALAALEADMPAPVVRGLVRSFRDEQGRQVAELPALASRGDLERVVLAAHSVKGAARLFGAEALADSAFAVERMARDGGGPQLAQAIAALEGSYRAVDLALHARFGSV